ncbi:heparanase-like [Neocloeon triangulifer]|uniref:heparanase-like n=1 Tax=Neocloeon triangulifer TaxID=2078957 RepID=UPI00286F71F6|nr:heparanase-like [Neocloeon triangulifer]
MYLPQRYLCFFALIVTALAAEPEKNLVTVATKKISNVVSDKFISISLDPELLMDHDFASTDLLKLQEMASFFAPAYLRLSGPWCQKYRFEAYGDTANEKYVVTGETVEVVSQLVRESGMKLLVCLNPTLRASDGSWNSTEARNLLEVLHMMDLNIAVELGYERLKNEPHMSGSQMGADLLALSDLLEEFPRFRKASIVAPDITSLKVDDKIRIAEMLKTAGSKIQKIMWHTTDYSPKITEGSHDLGSKVRLGLHEMASDRKDIHDELAFYNAAHKPLWISEAERPAPQGRFVDAMQWVSKLGQAARMDVDVIMHSPTLQTLLHPTPEFWVSALHKQLVGSSVLDTRFVNERMGRETHIFAHCSTTGVSLGGIVVFGVNYRDEAVPLELHGIKDSEVRVYMITPENNIFEKNIHVNKAVPSLSSWVQPIILSPSNKSISLMMPAKSIVFWDVPNAGASACMPKESDRKKRFAADEIEDGPEEDKYHCGWSIIMANLPIFHRKPEQETKGRAEEEEIDYFSSNNIRVLGEKENLQKVDGTSVEVDKDDGFVDKVRMQQFSDPGLSYMGQNMPFLIHSLFPDSVSSEEQIRAKRAAPSLNPPIDLLKGSQLLHTINQNRAPRKEEKKPGGLFAPKILHRRLVAPIQATNFAQKFEQFKRDFEQKLEAQRQKKNEVSKLVLKRKVDNLLLPRSVGNQYKDAWPRMQPAKTKSNHRIIGKKEPEDEEESNYKGNNNGKRGTDELSPFRDAPETENPRVKRKSGTTNGDFEFELLDQNDLNKVDSVWPAYKNVILGKSPSEMPSVPTTAASSEQEKEDSKSEKDGNVLHQFFETANRILCSVRRALNPSLPCTCNKNKN